MKKILILASLLLLVSLVLAQSAIVVWGPNTTHGLQNPPAGSDFIAVAGGDNFAVALRSNGTLVDWGSFSSVTGSTPSGNNFIAISAGKEHAVALRSNGTLVAWGKNNKGQCNVPAGSDFVQIAAGTQHSLARRANGTVVAWGKNSSNQCNVPAGARFSDIAAGSAFSVGISASPATAGQLIAWGNAYNGELNLPAGNDYVKVSTKNMHGLALRSNGQLLAWGNNAANTNVTPGVYRDMSAGWQANVGIKTDGQLTAWANLWALNTIPNWVQELGLTTVSCGLDFNLGLVGPPINPDEDEDGVPDHEDAYPTDPMRAYNTNYPIGSTTSWGTWAYEDMWPAQGDYDFNDLVLGYKLTIVTDAQFKIKDIIADLRLRAVGATFQNAFAIEFPFPASRIESLVSTADGAAYDMQIIDAGAHCILKVINNTADFVDISGHDVFWNTQLDQPHYPDVPLSFSISLTDSFDPATAPSWGMLNPYLIVKRDLGHEVHLPGFPPTMYADTSLFGMDDDTTNPATGRYYKTASNLPWALDLPTTWMYPIERKQITQAYLAFAPWAESAGSVHADWYLMLSDQIVPENIYNP